MQQVEMLNNAENHGVKISSWNNEAFKARGSAFVRNLSCEIEWEEIDKETGQLKKYNSILSKLGWQWERHWNVYAEKAPFGLMLSQLFDFLITCIKCNSYKHSFIEWEWDINNFYLISIKPAADHLWHRCLTGICIRSFDAVIDKNEIESEVLKLISGWGNRILFVNEPFLVKYEDTYYINCDLICAGLKETGVGGSFAGSPPVKFNLMRYLKSLPVFLSIYKSKRKLKYFEEIHKSFMSELEQVDSIDAIRSSYNKYLSFIFTSKIIMFASGRCIPLLKNNYRGELLNELNENYNKEFVAKAKEIEPAFFSSVNTNRITGAFWENSGEKIK